MISFSKIYHIMGLSCFRAISGLGWDWDWDGLDLCAGLFYEHRFAMLIMVLSSCLLVDVFGFLIVGNHPSDF